MTFEPVKPSYQIAAEDVQRVISYMNGMTAKPKLSRRERGEIMRQDSERYEAMIRALEQYGFISNQVTAKPKPRMLRKILDELAIFSGSSTEFGSSQKFLIAIPSEYVLMFKKTKIQIKHCGLIL